MASVDRSTFDNGKETLTLHSEPFLHAPKHIRRRDVRTPCLKKAARGRKDELRSLRLAGSDVNLCSGGMGHPRRAVRSSSAPSKRERLPTANPASQKEDPMRMEALFALDVLVAGVSTASAQNLTEAQARAIIAPWHSLFNVATRGEVKTIQEQVLTPDYELCAGYLPGECWGRDTSIKVVGNFPTPSPT